MNNLKVLQSDPSKFRSALRIDCDGITKPLSHVIDDWQRSDFSNLDPAWKRVVGQDNQGPQRAWLERPRGHSKTSDLAIQVSWALFASKRKITGYGCAADKDQAKLLRDSIDTLLRYNPWLGNILKTGLYSVENIKTGSKLNILSADVPGSWGLLPDFVVLDELTIWPKREMFDSLMSAAAKKAHCNLIIISNAGFRESWQYELRESIRTDPDWYFSRLEGPKASWISQKLLDEQKRILPRIAYERLWLNKWGEGSGDALDPDDIQRSITLSGPINKPKREYVFYAGLDLGLTRDKAALCLIGKHVGSRSESEVEPQLSDRQKMLIDCGFLDEPEPKTRNVSRPGTGKIKLADLRVWSPPKKGKINLEEIEDTILELDKIFNLAIGCDPYQAVHLIQRLQKRGVVIEEVPFIASNLKSMCSVTLEAFSDNKIEIYDNKQLVSDLSNLRVIEKHYGVRLDSPTGLSGHGDAATALSIALHCSRNSKQVFEYTPTSLIID